MGDPRDEILMEVNRRLIEPLAEAWASMDGKLEEFLAGRGKPLLDQPGGHYEGYMEDAKELMKRARGRGLRFSSAE